MVHFPIQTHPMLAHKKVPATMTQYSRNETYHFPESNSLTSADDKYFEMVHNEANWKGIQENVTFEELHYEEIKPKEAQRTRIDRHGAPDSNSLTEMDREYFNIIKTEDGLSQFFKTKRDPQSILPFKRLDTPVNRNTLKGQKEVNPYSDKGVEIPKHAFVSERHPSFKFHIVSPDKTNKNKKPIVGLYLGPNNL